MPYQLGQRERVTGAFKVAKLDVTLKYRKTSHPELLDLEIQAGAFEEKWTDWSERQAKLFDRLTPFLHVDDANDIKVSQLWTRMPDDEREEWLADFRALKRGISSEDVQPVLDFVDRHILEVDGVTDREGNAVTQWVNIPHDDRRELLGAIPPHEVANLYGDIRQTVALTVDQKNG